LTVFDFLAWVAGEDHLFELSAYRTKINLLFLINNITTAYLNGSKV